MKLCTIGVSMLPAPHRGLEETKSAIRMLVQARVTEAVVVVRVPQVGHERVRKTGQGPLWRRAAVHKPGVLLQQTLPVDGPGVPGRRRGPAGRVRVGVIPFLRFPSLDCNSPLIGSSRDDVVATLRFVVRSVIQSGSGSD